LLLNIYRTIKRVISILAHDRKYFYIAVFLSVFGGVVELIGVGTLYPFLALLAKPELVESNAVLKFLFDYGQFGDVRSFLVFFGGVALVTLLFSTWFMYYKHSFITRFCVGQTTFVSVRMLDSYLRKPMLFHVDNNSGALSKDVIEQSDQFTNGVIMAVMSLLGDGVILIVLVGLVLSIDSYIAIIFFVFFGLVFGIAMALTSNKIHSFGVESDATNGRRFSFCIGSLQSIKEIKTAGKESFFCYLFYLLTKKHAQCYSASLIIQQIPQSIMQFCAPGFIIGIALYFIASGDDLSTIVSTLALYAVIGYRLYPPLNNISGAISKIIQFQPVIDNITNTFAERHSPFLFEQEIDQTSETVSETVVPTIKFHQVGFAYPRGEHAILDNINLTIESKSMVGIVGKSGSGKTTLVDLLLGLMLPDHGEIQLDGETIKQRGEDNWQKTFGYVPQSVYIIDGTIAENIAFGVSEEVIDWKKLERTIHVSDLEEVINTLPGGLNFHVGDRGTKLSGGQRQRIGIARAIYRNAPVLILDESTSSLDGFSEKSIIETLQRLKKSNTVITIAHRSSIVRQCDRIVCIDHGEIVADGDYQSLCQTSPEFVALMSEMDNPHIHNRVT